MHIVGWCNVKFLHVIDKMSETRGWGECKGLEWEIGSKTKTQIEKED